MALDLGARLKSPPVLVAGAVCTAALAFAAIFGGWRGWFVASVAIFGVPLGAIGLRSMIALVPGAWRGPASAPTQRLALLAPLMALGVAPVLVTAGAVFPWAGHEASPLRRFWTDPLAFRVRTLLLLGLFSTLAWLSRGTRGAGAHAAILLVFTPLTTVAAFDWLLALDGRFASSGFGLYVLCIQMLSAFAAAVLLAPEGETTGLGAVMLTGLLLWAYFAFMPYFIVWSGDLPAGVGWYQARGEGVWAWLIGAVVALRLVPLSLLIFAGVRRRRAWLSVLAAMTLAAGALEFAWIGLPGACAASAMIYALAMLGLGGVLVAIIRPPGAT